MLLYDDGLKKLMKYLYFIKALVDVSNGTLTNIKNDIEMNHTCTSPTVYFVHEEIINAPINDLSNENAIFKSHDESSSQKSTLVQEGQHTHVIFLHQLNSIL